jgi:SAM-dependent methyltransferase
VGELKDSKWYGEQFNLKREYNLPPQEAGHYHVWQAIAELIDPKWRIADFGCGTGQLTELLTSLKCNVVLAVDFSEEGIRKTKERFKGKAEVGDLRNPETFRLVDYDIAIFSEVLEHLADDLWVLGNIPPGKRIVIGIPRFDAGSHLRWFVNWWDVIDRYSKLVSIEQYQIVDNWHFVFRGKKI